MRKAALAFVALLFAASTAAAASFTNFSYSAIATAPSPATTGTSIVVTAGQGALFPTPPFQATIWQRYSQPLASNAEVVTVTVVSTDTFTIVRAREGSTARSVITGDQIAATITAQVLTAFLTGVTVDSPLSGAGTSASHLTFAPQVTKTFLAGPTSGADAIPTFRTIAAADVPTLNQSTSGSAGTVTSIASHASTELSDTAGLARLAFPTFTTSATVSAAVAPSVILNIPGFAHGITSKTATDTPASYQTYDGYGGMYSVGIRKVADIPALFFDGVFGTTTASATVPAVRFAGSKKAASGTGVQALADGELVLQVINHTTPLLSIFGSGNVGINTTGALAKLAINGGVHVGGDSDPGDNNLLVDGTATVNLGLAINGNGGGSKPSCAVGIRGTFWYVAAAAGVKDTVEVCTKSAADSYAWATIY